MRHTDDEEIIAAVLRAVDHLGLAEKILEQALAGPEGRRLARKVLAVADSADAEKRAFESVRDEGASLAISLASRVFGITEEAIVGPNRALLPFHARCAAMLLLRRRGMSANRIGRAFDNRDHTTVLSAVRRAESMEASDAGYAARVAKMAEAMESAS